MEKHILFGQRSAQNSSSKLDPRPPGATPESSNAACRIQTIVLAAPVSLLVEQHVLEHIARLTTTLSWFIPNQICPSDASLAPKRRRRTVLS